MSSVADRDPAHLHPALRTVIESILADLTEAGWQPRVIETWRSETRQAELRATGASRVVRSMHQYTFPDGTPASLACDIIDRRYGWDERSPGFFAALESAAIAHHIYSGRGWGHPPDAAHVQLVPVDKQDEVWAGQNPLDFARTVL